MPSTRPRGYQHWREAQRRWHEIQREHPGVPWLTLLLRHYDYLYPKP
jgi:hypothetical protein